MTAQEFPSEPAMRAALQYVATSGMPSEHKSVLMDLLTRALREDAEQETQQAAAREHPQWRAEETEQLAAALHDKLATGWQQADECLMHLALQMHRSPSDVRAKAIELGLGASVDYAHARSKTPHRPD